MSDDKSSLFVFDKKELALLVIFFIVMSITTFVLGMKLGKSQAVSDLQKVKEGQLSDDGEKLPHMKSLKEEEVEELVNASLAGTQPSIGSEKAIEGDVEADAEGVGLSDETLAKLREEFASLEEKDFEVVKKDEQVKETTNDDTQSLTQVFPQDSDKPAETKSETQKKSVVKVTADIIGKYTIQLGSYRTYDEAQDFANGFIIRNYQPLINEVEIEGRGVWYRVSLGVFDSRKSAREYIDQEGSLFRNQDYIISQIQ